ncbi:MAG: hypothetical protein JNM09_18770 [Blastocatellia bacterium]|nr:hypothetical protein [Blastocatellia bacterium]
MRSITMVTLLLLLSVSILAQPKNLTIKNIQLSDIAVNRQQILKIVSDETNSYDVYTTDDLIQIKIMPGEVTLDAIDETITLGLISFHSTKKQTRKVGIALTFDLVAGNETLPCYFDTDGRFQFRNKTSNTEEVFKEETSAINVELVNKKPAKMGVSVLVPIQVSTQTVNKDRTSRQVRLSSRRVSLR